MRNPVDIPREYPLPKRATSLLAASALCLSGCTIDSYLTDANGIECDGKRTKVEFSDDVNQVTLATHSGADTLAITVSRRNGVYELHAQPIAGDTPTINTFAEDGSADPDYIVSQRNATWSVDVRDNESSVVVSGYCKED